MVGVAFKLEAQFSAGVWSDITADVRSADGIRSRHGMSGNGPLDRVAVPGTLEFALDNSTANSAGLLGYYSPRNTNCRTGWTYGIPVRLSVSISGGASQCLWLGRVRTIRPSAGKLMRRHVAVLATDCIVTLLETSGRDVPIRVNGSETTCLTDVLNVVPAAVRPDLVFTSPVDQYPYVFDDANDGSTVYGLIKNVVTSAWGLFYSAPTMTHDQGYVRYTNRSALLSAALTSQHTFTDGEILARGDDGFSVPDSTAAAFNRIRVTIHPRTITAQEAGINLYLSTGPFMVDANATVTVWGEFRDPTNSLKLVGGIEPVIPIVAGRDYLAYSSPSGGSDLTGNISIVTTAFAANAKFVITNSTATPVYITQLRLLGKGVYDNSPITRESYTAGSYGDHALDIDLPYQDDIDLAQDVADYVKAHYSTLQTQAEWLTFNARQSAALASIGASPEIGTVVTISETVTGVTATDFMIVGIEHEIGEGSVWTVRFRLAPTPKVAGPVWILDDPTYSVLGSTTVLGYF